MVTPTKERQALSAGAVWETLSRDPVVLATATVFTLVTALTLLPFLGSAEKGFLSYRLAPLVFLVLVLLALQWQLTRLKSLEDRDFWNDLSFGYGSWTAGALLWLFYPDPGSSLELLEDVLYALYYVGLLLAVERQPHRRHRWRPVAVERRLTRWSVTMIVTGFFVYFLLIPLLLDKSHYDSGVPASCLYLTLDAYLFLRLLYLVRIPRSPRWRLIYSTLALTAFSVFWMDLLEFLTLSRKIPWRWDSGWNLLTYVPYLLMVVTARLRHHPFPLSAPARLPKIRLEENLPGPLGQTMTFLVVVPLIHFVCGRLGLLSVTAARFQGGLVLAWIFLMGVLAWFQYRLLEKTLSELRRERQRTERALDKIDRSLRISIERQQTEAALRLSRRKFSEAFRACPDVMAITRLEDGRFLEVSPSCQPVFGLKVEECIGKTAEELGFWDRREDRTAVVEELRLHGSVRDFETGYRHRNGKVGRALFSATLAELDEEAVLFSVTHDITATSARQEELRRRLTAVDAVGALAIDAYGFVVYFNREAERLLGRRAETALEQPAEELGGVLSDCLAAGENAVSTELAVGGRRLAVYSQPVDAEGGPARLILLTEPAAGGPSEEGK